MQDKYLHEEFIKYLKDNKINKLIIGGDVFDNRQSVNVKVMNLVYNFFETLNELEIDTYVLIGNHDLYLTNSNEFSSIKLASNFQYVHIIDKPLVYKFDERTDILMVPWVIDNEAFIKKYTGCMVKTCIGHFPIVGFPMSGGHPNEDGIPPSFFNDNFHTTFSGHFHVYRADGKIIYPNNPFQFTRADSLDYDKGFCVINFDDNGYVCCIDYVNSKNIIRFEKFTYPEEIIETKVDGNLIDVFVDYGNNFDETKFKEYLEKIKSFGPAANPEIKIINNNVINLNNNINIDNIGSSIGLMKEYIEIQNIEEKPKVKDLMMELFAESNGAE
jgi:hypothetical protein